MPLRRNNHRKIWRNEDKEKGEKERGERRERRDKRQVRKIEVYLFFKSN